MKAVKFERDVFDIPRVVLFDKVEITFGKHTDWGFQVSYYHTERVTSFLFIRWFLWITIYHNDLEPSQQK